VDEMVISLAAKGLTTGEVSSLGNFPESPRGPFMAEVFLEVVVAQELRSAGRMDENAEGKLVTYVSRIASCCATCQVSHTPCG